MITRFQSTPLPLTPRPLQSRSGRIIQFGDPSGHVHTEKCNQGQCEQVKPKEGKAEERQFFLKPIIEKVKAFFQDIWNRIQNICNGIKEWWFPSSQKPTAPAIEKPAPTTEEQNDQKIEQTAETTQEPPKTELKKEPHQELPNPMDHHYCQPSGGGNDDVVKNLPKFPKPKRRCGSGCVH